MTNATKTVFLEKNLVDLFDISSKMETPPTDFFVKKKGWFLHLTRCFVFTFLYFFLSCCLPLRKKCKNSFMQLKETHFFEEKGLNITIFSILSEVQDLINNFLMRVRKLSKKG